MEGSPRQSPTAAASVLKTIQNMIRIGLLMPFRSVKLASKQEVMLLISLHRGITIWFPTKLEVTFSWL